MRSSRFSPRSLEPAQLERLTVAGEQLLDRLQTAVVGAVASGQARFDLVLGPRGAGKSHILGVLEGRLRAAPELLGRTVIVALPEQLHPLSLVQLLAQLLGELPDDPELGPTTEALRSLRRQRDPNQERRAVDLIRARLAGRSLIILLENLDELFTALGRDGQQRLRNILQTERRWSIVATSRSLIPAFTKYEAPFHGTFNQHRLTPLSPEQCRDMLAALADVHGHERLSTLLRTPRGLARVRGLHHLLGGNPRAMALLFRQLDEHRLDHFELALAELADELEPYLREQMIRLSPTQRALLELLVESWRPLTVTELSELSFSAQATTSNALRQLRGEALVQVLEVGRERYYEPGDPLLRLARANQRPRDAIAAFARVIRWWYAQASEADSSVRQYQVPPERARAEFVAHDGNDDGIVRRVLESTARADDPASQPARSSPTLELELSRAIGFAWHEHRLAELFSPRASLVPLLDVLPASVGWLVGVAMSLGLEESPASASGDGFAALRSAMLDQAPAGEMIGLHALGLVLESFCQLAELPIAEGVDPIAESVGADPQQPARLLLSGLYPWLASRRPLEPLRRLAARLATVHDIEWFPSEVLASAGPRAAVARLSEPERALVRTILELHRDHRGLEALALDARR